MLTPESPHLNCLTPPLSQVDSPNKTAARSSRGEEKGDLEPAACSALEHVTREAKTEAKTEEDKEAATRACIAQGGGVTLQAVQHAYTDDNDEEDVGGWQHGSFSEEEQDGREDDASRRRGWRTDAEQEQGGGGLGGEGDDAGDFGANSRNLGSREGAQEQEQVLCVCVWVSAYRYICQHTAMCYVSAY